MTIKTKNTKIKSFVEKRAKYLTMEIIQGVNEMSSNEKGEIDDLFMDGKIRTIKMSYKDYIRLIAVQYKVLYK